jgi:hypothetical protein
MADPPRYLNSREHTEGDTGIPRWMKVVGIIVAVVALLVIVMLLVGGGSGHKRPGGSGNQSPGGTFSSSGQSPGGTFSEKQQAEFAQCMREQGIDFRSRVGEDGQVEMSPGPGVDVNGAAFREAQAVCRAKFTPSGGQP